VPDRISSLERVHPKRKKKKNRKDLSSTGKMSEERPILRYITFKFQNIEINKRPKILNKGQKQRVRDHVAPVF
jgi:hypothetical protein